MPADPVNVELNKSVSMKIKGEEFNLNQGEQEIPTYLAVFLIGRKMANII